MPSPFTPNTEEHRKKMLDAIGMDSVEGLFSDIPEEVRNPDLNLPKAMSELDLRAYASELSARNVSAGEYTSFLGAGSYWHHIPAVVSSIASRGEFMTAYTPYQPEVSQGTLQVAYEFQSMICQLTGMDVANAGMYDGSTSLAEAALMACRVTRKNKVAILDSTSPLYTEVLDTYVQAPGIALELVKAHNISLEEDTACLIVQQPNFFGYLEDMQTLSNIAHDAGALLVVSVDPVSLGMFNPPSEYGADIVVAEGQGIGVPMSYGGPYVGIFACRQEFVRQMPGRIVGKTLDTHGKEAYVLTLQAREQHIRREHATSNICTSVALISLMTTVYLACMGKQGMRKVAELCYHKAHYAASLIENIPGFSILESGNGVFFREFTVRCPIPPEEINQLLLEKGIIGGLDVSNYLENALLLCVTEMNSREDIENLAKTLREIGES
ncbi:MAG: aminomethyl-transferring glycine dehydrogenase subunit GcvPA [Chloroflexota bacterium]|nr:aminomethyl-transferring glycine dehydrogenase subunit GcvPA [Chloroflexota bacterium]MEC9438919.1 aminomethyl-transferring glycine dehydrogenase subunit GcvPA [Chloroflexota bacterium]MQF66467.1 aminomethyl-transferring glycine dehydrogenase subunit GcvPA [SAR202 cluster bacterium AC-647-P02_OGT_505m]|tara:strand:- start:2395 stop:3714 length:1320 start_codon:yes stop_codon:yes gene_type:complete